MNYKFWVAVALLILAGVVARTVILNIQGQSGLADIQRRGILRVGLDASFPPFEMLDEQGQVIGFDAEIARQIGRDLGVTVEFRNIGFDGLYDAVRSDQVDLIISGLPIDPYLTEDVAYSVPYFNAGQVLVTTQAEIQSLEDLAGQTVAVEWGSMADMEARQLQKTLPDLVISPQPDPQTALQFESAIVDSITGLTAPNHRLVTYLTNDWYAAAVALDNRALLDEVNETLTHLIESGQLQEMQAHWF